jgi:hypothetical protein
VFFYSCFKLLVSKQASVAKKHILCLCAQHLLKNQAVTQFEIETAVKIRPSRLVRQVFGYSIGSHERMPIRGGILCLTAHVVMQGMTREMLREPAGEHLHGQSQCLLVREMMKEFTLDCAWLGSLREVED